MPRRKITEADLMANPRIAAQIRKADKRWESGGHSTISADEFRSLIEDATSE